MQDLQAAPQEPLVVTLQRQPARSKDADDDDELALARSANLVDAQLLVPLAVHAVVGGLRVLLLAARRRRAVALAGGLQRRRLVRTCPCRLAPRRFGAPLARVALALGALLGGSGSSGGGMALRRLRLGRVRSGGGGTGRGPGALLLALLGGRAATAGAVGGLLEVSLQQLVQQRDERGGERVQHVGAHLAQLPQQQQHLQRVEGDEGVLRVQLLLRAPRMHGARVVQRVGRDLGRRVGLDDHLRRVLKDARRQLSGGAETARYARRNPRVEVHLRHHLRRRRAGRVLGEQPHKEAPQQAVQPWAVLREARRDELHHVAQVLEHKVVVAGLHDDVQHVQLGCQQRRRRVGLAFRHGRGGQRGPRTRAHSRDELLEVRELDARVGPHLQDGAEQADAPPRQAARLLRISRDQRLAQHEVGHHLNHRVRRREVVVHGSAHSTGRRAGGRAVGGGRSRRRGRSRSRRGSDHPPIVGSKALRVRGWRPGARGRDPLHACGPSCATIRLPVRDQRRQVHGQLAVLDGARRRQAKARQRVHHLGHELEAEREEQALVVDEDLPDVGKLAQGVPLLEQDLLGPLDGSHKFLVLQPLSQRRRQNVERLAHEGARLGLVGA